MRGVVLRCLIGLIFGGVSLMPQAQERPPVDGESGVLHVRGSLTESPCALEMSSAWQSVSLGNTGSAQLEKDQTQSVSVQLHLRDCQALTSRNRDDISDNLVWGIGQPAISVRFTAPVDKDNPQLFAVSGASGFGLRLKDVHGRDVRPDSKGSPLLLNHGQDTLIYSLTPERTRAPLIAGAWYAIINFDLEYD